MPASACLSTFSEEKATLLWRYRWGVEAALLRANFLQSSDRKVLQALVIYLTFVRNSENEPDIRALTSIAVGNAMRMGLNCEAIISNLTAFEAEMCRRIWWQVYVLDVRIAMECGLEPSILEQTVSTKKPRNINDVALHPDMAVIPDNQNDRTEMTLILVRIQGSELTRRTIFSDTFNKANGYPTLTKEEGCQKVHELQETAEMKYLTCNDSQIPLHVVASATAKLTIAKLKVIICNPNANQGQGNPLRDRYQVLCLDVLRESHDVRCYKPGHPWSWLFETCVEWDALTYVLLDLCVTPWNRSTEDAFQLVDKAMAAYQNFMV
ncbi:hypothetical protein FBEOM_10488 [Fusarium beomiforme]|uniref:Xylanolytic transcriptional activator regulatory domain-containing protein n=1 Tax=Fusarium beomiforme TaxID=44412 RepID=A0A9P5DSK5_9HYPO|nr:hypothetical protein FBEOM_10488 [Fusarium beomiforme]